MLLNHTKKQNLHMEQTLPQDSWIERQSSANSLIYKKDIL